MITHPTLYKRTSSGATQRWWIEQNEHEYRVHSGQIDGKTTVSKWKAAKGKNIGKANETTNHDQATLEVEAAYRKKQSKGQYHTSIDQIDTEIYFKPMKAKKYEERWHKIDHFAADETYDSQPKLNGIRCIIKSDGMWSYGGKPIVSVPHVWESVKHIFDTHPDIKLDGELYNHELRHLLNRIAGLCKKTKPTDGDLEEAQIIQFHMYDVTGEADLDGGRLDSNTPWRSGSEFDRVTALHEVVDGFLANAHPVVQQTETTPLQGQEHTDDMNREYLVAEYEGQMIRFGSGVYDGGKYSAKMLKRKEFMEEEFIIKGFTEGEGNRAGMAGNIVYWLDPDGPDHPDNIFATGISGGEAFYTELWETQDQYIGNRSEGTVRFLKYTEYGKPEIPVTHAVFPGGRNGL